MAGTAGYSPLEFSGPAAFKGNEEAARQYFADVYAQIRSRLDILCALSLAGLDHAALRQVLDDVALG